MEAVYIQIKHKIITVVAQEFYLQLVIMDKQ